MTTPEKTIEQYLVRMCAAREMRCLKVKVVGMKGFPDRMIMLGNGRAFFAETKTSVGVLSPEQKREHARLQREGFQVAVLHSQANVDFLMEYIKLYV
jgi:hypothetical protein